MNIYYVAINKKDFYKKDFIFDVYSLVVKNLKPFSLERKTSNQNKQEMIYMLWKERVPLEIYKFICSDENFLYLNGKNVLYAKVSEIVAKFIEMDTENFALQTPCGNLKTFFSTFILAHIRTFIVQLNNVVLTSKLIPHCL